MMPDLDGIWRISSIKSRNHNYSVYFITSKSERVDLRKGMEMGADDYLTKPFGRLELLNAIETREEKTVKTFL
jgi:DNA-binding response OmpR family regulator